MLVDLFYLAVIWLLLSLGLLLALGPSTRHGGFFRSLAYLVLLIMIGDVIALALLKEPITLVGAASAVMLVAGVLLSLSLRDWNAPSQVFFLCSLIATTLYLSYALAITAFSPLSPFAFIFSFLLFLLEMAALGLSLTYVFELLDVLGRVRWRRWARPKPLGSYVPMVSLHVPTYNEPPELVEKTLRALANLDYPAYEVILIDNNTPEEATWQPLADVCQRFGFKCLHLDRWPGYKSGALNFALTMTDPRAEIIGVIDADYIVQPDYLRRIVPYFEDPTIAFVQTPQDYRNYQANRFFQAAYDGYKYFFALSMPSRNERNAIIFCGTMGLLRKKVLQEIGGWDEWCITEDAEASLRILNRGYSSLYVPETFGRGLMPLDFEGLKKQRFRWAFGGVQILKKHWHKLMPWARWLDPANRLSGAQRYFYLFAGLQWFNELLTFAFTVMVLISAVLTITGHSSFLRPSTEAFVILPLVLIGTNLLRALWGLRHALAISWKRAFHALTLWFSLTWVVALACVQAVVRQRGVFLRTPKALTKMAWARALQAASLETILGGACIIGGLAAISRAPSVLTFSLLLLCLSQASIYLSAPAYSILSLRAARGRRLVESDRAEIYGSIANETRLGLQIGLASLVLLIVVLVASLWPAPTASPSWQTIVNPRPLITPQSQVLATLMPTLAVPTEPSASPTAPPATPGATATPASNPSPTPAATGSPGVSPTAPASSTPTPPIFPTSTPAPSTATSPASPTVSTAPTGTPP